MSASSEIKTAASFRAFVSGRLSEVADGKRVLKAVPLEEAKQAAFKSINIATRDTLYDLNVENYRRNSAMLKSVDRGIGGLQRIYSGQPAFLVAAGPSLNKNIDQLREVNKQGWPIFCVDAAYRILRENGIKVDWVVMIDTKASQAMCWDGVKHDGATLLSISCAHPDAIAAWPGDVRFFNSLGDDEDEAIQLEHGQDFGSVAVGGNVATAMLGIAFVFCEADPIVLVGHDYSFPGWSNYYAKGGDDRLVPKNKRAFPTWDIHGRTVHTDLSLWSYAEWTVDLLDQLKNDLGVSTTFVNATEGGMLGCTKKPGELRTELEYMSLREAISRILNGQLVAFGTSQRAPADDCGAMAASANR